MQTFQLKFINGEGYIPERATEQSVGYDLKAAEDSTLVAKTRGLISTHISVSPPQNCYIRIAARSGLSCKGIDIGAGVIDPDYRGEVKVLMINNSNLDFYIVKGTNIAQMIFESCVTPICTVVDELSITQRGENGFGSTDTQINSNDELTKLYNLKDQINRKIRQLECNRNLEILNQTCELPINSSEILLENATKWFKDRQNSNEEKKE